MTQFKTATIGSVSHGTMRNEDLLNSFADELETRILLNGEYFSQPENFDQRDTLNNIIHAARESASGLETAQEEDHEYASQLVSELMDRLELFAPVYCYFGSHPGDGSDYGYWPCLSSVEELETFSDLSEVPDDQAEDFAVVNDHGNVSVYCVTPEGYKNIWSVV